MHMITVKTEDELKQAIKNNKGESIRVEGAYAKTLAKKISSKKKVKKVAIGGGLALVGCLLAAPFTGGASLLGVAAGATAMGVTIGTVTLTTAELAMIIGATAGVVGLAISKGYKIKIGKGDAYVELEPK